MDEAQLDNVNLADSCMSLNLHLGKLGTSKKVRAKKLEGDTDGDAQAALTEGVVLTDAKDPRLIRASKKILQCPSLKFLVKFDGETGRTIRDKSIQHLLRHGMRFVPLSNVEELDGYLEGRAAKRAEIVETILTEEYEPAIVVDEEYLGSTFRRADYLSVPEARQKFVMEWEWLEFRTPQKLRSLSSEIFKKETDKARARVHDAATEVVASMRTGLLTVLTGLVEKLKEPEEGKRRKQIRDNSVTRIVDFLNNLQQLNVAGDGELDALVEKARGVVTGLDVGDLKSSDEMREAVRTEIESLLPDVQALVTDAPKRRIVLTQAQQEAQVVHAESLETEGEVDGQQAAL